MLETTLKSSLMLLSCLFLSSLSLAAQQQASSSAKSDAWALLRAGVDSTSSDTRVIAVGALGIILRNHEAAQIAEHALADEKPEVRMAAATALGKMESRSSIPKLIAALDDEDPAVVLAAAQSLVHFKNEKGYDVYYEVLTGERKGEKGAVAKELDALKNPKKLAELGFEEGIGFVPFGGMGLETFKVLRGDANTAVRAAAAKVLTEYRDPDVDKALIEAVSDKSWHVRVAAIDALAERDDPRLLAPVESAMQDEKDSVKYSAAAAVIRLTDIEGSRLPKTRKQPKQKRPPAENAKASF